MKSIASLTILLIVLFNPVFANGGQKGYCAHAQTTADLVSCIGDHVNAENANMTVIYKALEQYYADNLDYLSDLNARQDEWITFRDKKCAFEASLYEGGSLERVQSLSCQARLTSNHIEHLKILLGNADIPEFSSPPRWVNVLKADYGDIFWRLASTKMIDVDCDGQEEHLVQGLKKIDGGYEMILSISDSPITGRPIVTIINFEDQKNCQISDTYDILHLPEPKPKNGVLQCVQQVHINTQNCGQFNLVKNNNKYLLKKKEKNVEN
jgi:uncharacterized protein YecT (DUF1311 family)